MREIVYYTIQRYVGSWEDDRDFDTRDEAEVEITWMRKYQPEYKYRIVEKRGVVTYEREEA